jgi:hypothetical protein
MVRGLRATLKLGEGRDKNGSRISHNPALPHRGCGARTRPRLAEPSRAADNVPGGDP